MDTSSFFFPRRCPTPARPAIQPTNPRPGTGRRVAEVAFPPSDAKFTFAVPRASPGRCANGRASTMRERLLVALAAAVTASALALAPPPAASTSAFSLERTISEALTVKALRAYHSIEGDVLTRDGFRVPAEAPWPRECWDFDLGGALRESRAAQRRPAEEGQDGEIRRELDLLGFEWDEETVKYERLRAGLQCYFAQHGNLHIPRDWIVPAEKPWPRCCWGMRLGRRVYSMSFWYTHVMHKPERREELGEIDFDWQRLQSEYNIVLDALVAFKECHGHLCVPGTFVVPSGSAHYPAHTWSLKLGQRVARIRSAAEYVDGHPGRWFQLEELGFVWDARDHAWQQTLRALHCFERRTGHCDVPQDFVVPSCGAGDAPAAEDEDGWPADLRGLKLGQRAHNMRVHGTYGVWEDAERQKALAKIGFRWSRKPGKQDQWERFLAALAAYRDAHGHAQVPQRYVVPKDSAFPRDTWTLALGQAVHDVRRKRRFLTGRGEELALQRRRQLDALGFVWVPTRGRPRRVKAAPATASEAPPPPKGSGADAKAPLREMSTLLDAVLDESDGA